MALKKYTGGGGAGLRGRRRRTGLMRCSGAGARHGWRGTQWRRGCASWVAWYTMAARARVMGVGVHNGGAGARHGCRGTQWRRGSASWVSWYGFTQWRRGCASWVAWHTMAARVRVMGVVVHNGGAGARHGCRGTQWRRGCASWVAWYGCTQWRRGCASWVAWHTRYTMATRVRVLGFVLHNVGAGARQGWRGTQ